MNRSALNTQAREAAMVAVKRVMRVHPGTLNGRAFVDGFTRAAANRLATDSARALALADRKSDYGIRGMEGIRLAGEVEGYRWLASVLTEDTPAAPETDTRSGDLDDLFTREDPMGDLETRNWAKWHEQHPYVPHPRKKDESAKDYDHRLKAQYQEWLAGAREHGVPHKTIIDAKHSANMARDRHIGGDEWPGGAAKKAEAVKTWKANHAHTMAEPDHHPAILSKSEYEKHQDIVSKMGSKAPRSVEALNAHLAAGGGRMTHSDPTAKFAPEAHHGMAHKTDVPREGGAEAHRQVSAKDLQDNDVVRHPNGEEHVVGRVFTKDGKTTVLTGHKGKFVDHPADSPDAKWTLVHRPGSNPSHYDPSVETEGQAQDHLNYSGNLSAGMSKVQKVHLGRYLSGKDNRHTVSVGDNVEFDSVEHGKISGTVQKLYDVGPGYGSALVKTPQGTHHAVSVGPNGHKEEVHPTVTSKHRDMHAMGWNPDNHPDPRKAT